MVERLPGVAQRRGEAAAIIIAEVAIMIIVAGHHHAFLGQDLAKELEMDCLVVHQNAIEVEDHRLDHVHSHRDRWYASAGQQAAHVGSLTDMLQVVGEHADQPYAQGDRRIPALVDDAVEPIGGDAVEQLSRSARHGFVVCDEHVRTSRLDASDIGGGLVMMLIVVWLFANYFGWWGFTWRTSWPLVLVIGGAGMMLRAMVSRRMRDRSDPVDFDPRKEENSGVQ